jgi:hypothetical protein
MKRLALFSLALPLVLTASAAIAQEGGPPERDPVAMAALDRMGAALAKRMDVNVHADITAEDVLVSGQKLQYGGTIDIAARRPNLMRMSMKIGPSAREFFYDGKQATLFVPALNMYASAAAPPTIREMLQQIQDKHNVEMPLSDLFEWSSNPASAKAVTSAIAAGKEEIGGFTCEQYAMRQEGADWQIWLREGPDALPCKIVITMTGDPAMPQFSAVYDWKNEPPPGPEAYAFTPPAGSSPMALGMIKSARRGN